jgi:hypothetical protein
MSKVAAACGMLIDISTATLRKMVKLSERKEALMSAIQKIDREMVALQRGSVTQTRPTRQRSSATSTRKPGRSTKKSGRNSRGALKERILQVLRAAGSSGSTIRELSEKLGVKSANLYVWFNGTGKNIAGIRKIGPAKYRLSE